MARVDGSNPESSTATLTVAVDGADANERVPPCAGAVIAKTPAHVSAHATVPALDRWPPPTPPPPGPRHDRRPAEANLPPPQRGNGDTNGRPRPKRRILIAGGHAVTECGGNPRGNSAEMPGGRATPARPVDGGA